MTGPWPRWQRRCVHSQAAASDESRRLRFAGEVRSVWASAARTGSVSSPAHRAKASSPFPLTARLRQAGGRDRGGPTLAPETSSGMRPESEAPGTRVGPCVTWARQLVCLCRGPGRSAGRSGTSPCPSLGERGGRGRRSQKTEEATELATRPGQDSGAREQWPLSSPSSRLLFEAKRAILCDVETQWAGLSAGPGPPRGLDPVAAPTAICWEQTPRSRAAIRVLA